MLVDEMLNKIDSHELVEWMAHFKLKEFEQRMELDKAKAMSRAKGKRGRV